MDASGPILSLGAAAGGLRALARGRLAKRQARGRKKT